MGIFSYTLIIYTLYLIKELPLKDIYLERPNYKFSNTLTNNKNKLCDDSSYSMKMVAFLLVGEWIEALKANGFFCDNFMTKANNYSLLFKELIVISINDKHKPFHNDMYNLTIEQDELWSDRFPIKELKPRIQEVSNE